MDTESDTSLLLHEQPPVQERIVGVAVLLLSLLPVEEKIFIPLS